MDSDADLLVLLRQGDEQAFALLVGRYHTRLTRFALSFVGRRDLAEDVAQETWLGLLRGLDRFEQRAPLRTWLFQICANRARTLAARENRVVPVDPTGPAVEPHLFDAAGGWVQPPQPWTVDAAGDAAADDAALVALARAAVERLPDAQRQVMTLRDVEGMTSAEVCEILAISEANQRVLLHRARSRVRAMLHQEVTRS